MRLRNLVLILAALAVVVALAACSSGQSSGDGQKDQGGKKASEEQAQKKEPPKKMTKEAKSKQVAPKEGVEDKDQVNNRLKPPKNKNLKLTVPAMKEIEDDTIPTGTGIQETLFRDYAGVHLRDTGYPWQKNANVYIAGHRIGFPGRTATWPSTTSRTSRKATRST